MEGRSEHGRGLTRRGFLKLSGGTIAGACAASLAAGWSRTALAAPTTYHEVRVDASSATGTFNRALFSATGYAQLMVSAGSLAQDTYALLNPAGTQQRIETMMDLASPQRGAFRPDRMFRFVDNTDDAYYKKVTGLGMEPVLLCAYNAPWLTTSGRLNEPPTDPQEWADIVADVVEHFNGDGGDPDYNPRVRYVEVWNEPNLQQFWTGTADQYFDLFKVTADTIHSRFPGVMVGGPVYSPGVPDYYDYGRSFIVAVGDDADFFDYHSYGDSVSKIRSDIELWRDYITGHTSHKSPKLMVTESEQFITDDAAKIQYMLDRQFALLDYAETMLGWHQFCLYEYKEGWYTFGLIHGDGSVFARNYWPYWIFRDAAGHTLSTTSSASGSGRYVATRSEDGKKLNLVYWRPEGSSDEQVTRFTFDMPRDGTDRVFSLSRVSGSAGEVVAAAKVSGQAAQFVYTSKISPGTAVSLTLDGAEAATKPWVGLSSTASEIPLHGTFEATASLVNTTPTTIGGDLRLAGLPSDWSATLVSGSEGFAGLDTGDAATATWRVRADSVTSGALAFYAQASVTGADSAHSIPVRVTVLRPVSILSIPDYTYFAPGETRGFTLEITNVLSSAINGTVSLVGPSGWETSPAQNLALAAKATSTYDFTMSAPSTASTGAATAHAQVTINGDVYTEPISLIVKQYDPDRPSTIADLSSLYDADGFSYDSNRSDGNLDYGGYTLPADTFPGNQWVRYMGVLFQTPDVSDGSKNEMVFDGQHVSLPEGDYAALALLVNATNGDKTSTVTLDYADGTSEQAALTVSDWCAGAHHGEEAVIWFDHRHSASGDAPPPCGIYCVELPVDPGRALRSVSFGAERDLHLFALSAVKG